MGKLWLFIKSQFDKQQHEHNLHQINIEIRIFPQYFPTTTTRLILTGILLILGEIIKWNKVQILGQSEYWAFPNRKFYIENIIIAYGRNTVQSYHTCCT